MTVKSFLHLGDKLIFFKTEAILVLQRNKEAEVITV